jgi:hypothetical protein
MSFTTMLQKKQQAQSAIWLCYDTQLGKGKDKSFLRKHNTILSHPLKVCIQKKSFPATAM